MRSRVITAVTQTPNAMENSYFITLQKFIYRHDAFIERLILTLRAYIPFFSSLEHFGDTNAAASVRTHNRVGGIYARTSNQGAALELIN